MPVVSVKTLYIFSWGA